MLRLIICDDEKYYADLLYDHICKYMNKHNIECDITVTCSPKKIIENEMSFDIAVLDIEMGNINGTVVAEELKRRNNKTVIFFITNYKVV